MHSITLVSVVLLAMTMIPLSAARPTAEDKVTKAYPEANPLLARGVPTHSVTPVLPIDIPASQPAIPHTLDLVDLTATIHLDLSVLGLVNAGVVAYTVVGLGVHNELLFARAAADIKIGVGAILDLDVDLKAAVGADIAVLDQLVTLAVELNIGLETYVVNVPYLI
ncbi:hypothetical protein IWQ62_005863 [Dispira parvispora]|uniref:Uncharacterized protein n=1 Tax=Dispira parvispora TaxID=1520584 RepID=A0A9W8APL6_9FUNG|nr:hypothetical protein IWQ62_005863 [Dispira parvispora]